MYVFRLYLKSNIPGTLCAFIPVFLTDRKLLLLSSINLALELHLQLGLNLLRIFSTRPLLTQVDKRLTKTNQHKTACDERTASLIRDSMAPTLVLVLETAGVLCWVHVNDLLVLRRD